MKLYLTLEDDEGLKVERVIRDTEECIANNIEDVVESMKDSIIKARLPL